ncbi:MAG: hypothetical protein KDC61_14410 [Saprospiraceae bacterium]|nr:hypothetical protein [Saprospiraceae bacterium]
MIFIILALCIPAHLIFLGLGAFNGDEAIRAWVAMEMDFSGNYIATTMHGASYINKPPLFNWIILAATKLWGAYDELPSRLVTVFFLALFGFTVFRAVRKQFSTEFAFLAAITTVTSGRFLFYDSMLGLIDTTFSLVMYGLFMSIYFFGRREQWSRMFWVSYLLMAVGFMLKAFPAIVFQGLTLLAGLYYFRQLRLLFSWKHVAGALPAVAIIGLYLCVYAMYRPVDDLLFNLLHESTKRTVAEHSFGNTIYHIAKFPFDSIYHFLPFSLMLVFWIDRRLWSRIRSNDFVFFNFVVLAVNLPVYWTSSQVMPRYLLMLIPLFNTIGLYLLEQNIAERSWRYKFLFYTLGTLLTAGSLLMVVMPFIEPASQLPWIWPASVALLAGMGICAAMYFYDKQRFLWWFVTALILIRIGFDLIVLPVRHDGNDTSVARSDAIRMAEKYKDRHWYVYDDSETREPAMFYATASLGYIIERTDRLDIPGALYLVNLKDTARFDGVCLDTLRTDYRSTTLLLFTRDGR